MWATLGSFLGYTDKPEYQIPGSIPAREGSPWSRRYATQKFGSRTSGAPQEADAPPPVRTSRWDIPRLLLRTLWIHCWAGPLRIVKPNKAHPMCHRMLLLVVVLAILCVLQAFSHEGYLSRRKTAETSAKARPASKSWGLGDGRKDSVVIFPETYLLEVSGQRRDPLISRTVTEAQLSSISSQSGGVQSEEKPKLVEVSKSVSSVADGGQSSSKTKTPKTEASSVKALPDLPGAGSAAHSGSLIPSGSTPIVIGSKKLKPGKPVVTFRKRWECLTSLETAEWRKNSGPRVLPWPKEPLWHCDAKEGYLGISSNPLVKSGQYTPATWPVANSLKFYWTPKSLDVCGAHRPPSFLLFNAHEFCETMRRSGGNLFVVGDSISSQFFTSLTNQVRTYGVPVKPVPPSEECASLIASLNKSTATDAQALLRKRLPCQTHLVCGDSLDSGGVLLSYAESILLRRVRKDAPEQHSLYPNLDNHPEIAWGEEMKRQRVSVAVLNRGAHYIRGQIGVDQLNHTLQQLRGLLPDALIVFRSTPAGHPGCNHYIGPIKKPMQHKVWPFNWDHFGEENAKAKVLVESVGGVFLDIDPMTSLRPDWHVGGNDCLHYCLPGVPDDWVKVFAKMLHDLV